ncbi:hypothetical protein [Streptomyces sp. NPDC051776]|uniref:hypothetical protein n=1 Tax=Streptomyces sp. NPDC051776 TaxID=3155414 RepID=UPI003444EFF3
MAILCAVGIISALSAPTAAAAYPHPSTSSGYFNSLTSVANPDWMSSLPDDTGLGRMSIPGTHDTLAIQGDPQEWYRTQEEHGFGGATLTAQLDAGIRAIDIRVRAMRSGFSGPATYFDIHHSDAFQAHFSEALDKAKGFLENHPGETVLMKLKAECDNTKLAGPGNCNDYPKTTTAYETAAIFQKYIADYPGLFWGPSVAGTGTASTPTLGDVRGKIVLTEFRDHEGYGLTGFNTGDIPWNLCDLDQRWNLIKTRLDQLRFDERNTVQTTGLSASCFITDTYVDVANGKGGKKGMNKRLLEDLPSNATRQINVIEMDFPGGELISRIIRLNTGR